MSKSYQSAPRNPVMEVAFKHAFGNNFSKLKTACKHESDGIHEVRTDYHSVNKCKHCGDIYHVTNES